MKNTLNELKETIRNIHNPAFIQVLAEDDHEFNINAMVFYCEQETGEKYFGDHNTEDMIEWLKDKELAGNRLSDYFDILTAGDAQMCDSIYITINGKDIVETNNLMSAMETKEFLENNEDLIEYVSPKAINSIGIKIKCEWGMRNSPYCYSLCTNDSRKMFTAADKTVDYLVHTGIIPDEKFFEEIKELKANIEERDTLGEKLNEYNALKDAVQFQEKSEDIVFCLIDRETGDEFFRTRDCDLACLIRKSYEEDDDVSIKTDYDLTFEDDIVEDLEWIDTLKNEGIISNKENFMNEHYWSVSWSGIRFAYTKNRFEAEKIAEDMKTKNLDDKFDVNIFMIQGEYPYQEPVHAADLGKGRLGKTAEWIRYKYENNENLTNKKIDDINDRIEEICRKYGIDIRRMQEIGRSEDIHEDR